MRSSIDSAGRIVVPKALRDVLGFAAGTDLDLHERDGTLVIAPVPVPMKLVRRGRGLVAVPDQKMPSLTADAVRAVLESERR